MSAGFNHGKSRLIPASGINLPNLVFIEARINYHRSSSEKTAVRHTAFCEGLSMSAAGSSRNNVLVVCGKGFLMFVMIIMSSNVARGCSGSRPTPVVTFEPYYIAIQRLKVPTLKNGSSKAYKNLCRNL